MDAMKIEEVSALRRMSDYLRGETNLEHARELFVGTVMPSLIGKLKRRDIIFSTYMEKRIFEPKTDGRYSPSDFGFKVVKIDGMKDSEIGFIAVDPTEEGRAGYATRFGIYILVGRGNDTEEIVLKLLRAPEIQSTLYHEFIHTLQFRRWFGKPKIQPAGTPRTLDTWSSNPAEVEAILGSVVTVIYDSFEKAEEDGNISYLTGIWSDDPYSWKQIIFKVIERQYGETVARNVVRRAASRIDRMHSELVGRWRRLLKSAALHP